MSEMFNHYPQSDGYVPNNRPRCHKHKDITIMAGETAEHTFEVPFNTVESCLSVEVIYKLGLTDIITKESNDFETFITDHNTSIITCKLSTDETSLFANTLLNASVQLRFCMNDNSITYSEIYKIKVSTALDAKKGDTPTPPTPGPGIIGGLGYTED